MARQCVTATILVSWVCTLPAHLVVLPISGMDELVARRLGAIDASCREDRSQSTSPHNVFGRKHGKVLRGADNHAVILSGSLWLTCSQKGEPACRAPQALCSNACRLQNVLPFILVLRLFKATARGGAGAPSPSERKKIDIDGPSLQTWRHIYLGIFALAKRGHAPWFAIMLFCWPKYSRWYSRPTGVSEQRLALYPSCNSGACWERQWTLANSASQNLRRLAGVTASSAQFQTWVSIRT